MSSTTATPIAAPPPPITSNMVFVACKLPNGIVLELGIGKEAHQRVAIRGMNAPAAHLSPVGHGVTQVDRSFMENWMKKHQWLPAVKNKGIFVADSLEDLHAMCMDFGKEKTGMERLNPANAPKGIEIDTAHMEQGKRDIAQIARV